MSIRTKAGRAAAAAIVCLFSIAALAAPALGQTVAREALEDQDTLAWLGCWDVMEDPEDDSQEPPKERQLICVAPGDAPKALDLTVLVDGKAVATETIVTDGSRQPVGKGGCDGWIRSVLSGDRRRLYLQSEATCSDGKPRHLSGASMMVSADIWVDIHVLRIDGEREIAIQHYRPVDADVARLPGMLPTAVHSARLAAAARLTAADVIEALQLVDPAVVEAMLLESDASFGVNSDLLLRLDDAGVPGEIIDLMVALSFPEHFTVEGSTVEGNTVEVNTVARQPEVYYESYWSPWYPYYGYGYGYYYHHGHGGGHHDKNRGGKVVSGRGYVSVQQTESSGGFLQGFSNTGGGGVAGGASGGSSSGNAGSASGSGYKSGNSTPTRPAVPKE